MWDEEHQRCERIFSLKEERRAKFLHFVGASGHEMSLNVGKGESPWVATSIGLLRPNIKSLSTMNSIGIKTFFIKCKDLSNACIFSKNHKRCISKVHWDVTIFFH